MGCGAGWLICRILIHATSQHPTTDTSAPLVAAKRQSVHKTLTLRLCRTTPHQPTLVPRSPGAAP
jgi:hypothetical protein